MQHLEIEGSKQKCIVNKQYFSSVSLEQSEYLKNPLGTNAFDLKLILSSQSIMLRCFFLAILAQTFVCTDEHMRPNNIKALGYWEKCFCNFPSP